MIVNHAQRHRSSDSPGGWLRPPTQLAKESTLPDEDDGAEDYGADERLDHERDRSVRYRRQAGHQLDQSAHDSGTQAGKSEGPDELDDAHAEETQGREHGNPQRHPTLDE